MTQWIRRHAPKLRGTEPLLRSQRVAPTPPFAGASALARMHASRRGRWHGITLCTAFAAGLAALCFAWTAAAVPPPSARLAVMPQLTMPFGQGGADRPPRRVVFSAMGLAGLSAWQAAGGEASATAAGMPKLSSDVPDVRCEGESGPQAPRSHCVSTAAAVSPGQYLPPWVFKPMTASAAAEALAAALRPRAIAAASSGRPPVVEVRGPLRRPGQGPGVTAKSGDEVWAVRAEVPSLSGPAGTAAASARRDVLEVLLDDRPGIAIFKAVGFEDRLYPWPPFCWTPGCINGPPVRGRLEELRKQLGWAPDEPADTLDGWVPIFFH